MIRKLTLEDKENVLSYLYKESTYNIFIIGDIETFGIETDFQRVYGEFNDKHELMSVFLRYQEYAVFYSHLLKFNVDYLTIFKEDPFKYISGKSELLDLIQPYLEGFKQKSMYFCKAESMKVINQEDENIHLLKTTDEASRLYDLLVRIDEFDYSKSDRKDRFIEQKTSDQKMGITLYIEKDGMIVSSVATTAETTQNAMVVAVATHPSYRNQGYASRLMQKLMTIYMIEKKKSLCLFYDNPNAGAIYHKLGFETIGKWDTWSSI
jgi:predicted GNAT family acetyltransferase